MEILASDQVHATPWLRVREDVVRRPDGSTGTSTVVEGADIALVIALDADRVRLVEQYRHPLGRRCWELPSGGIDPGVDDDPEAAATRELREETGLRSGTLVRIGTLDVSPSVLGYRCHVFLATDLVSGEPRPDPDEHDLRSAWFTRAEAEQMISDGDLTDAKSLAAWTLLLLHERARTGVTA